MADKITVAGPLGKLSDAIDKITVTGPSVSFVVPLGDEHACAKHGKVRFTAVTANHDVYCSVCLIESYEALGYSTHAALGAAAQLATWRNS